MNMSDVSQRLEKALGLGTRPDLRRELYDRLQQIVEAEGERAYVIIARCAQEAQAKDSPGRWFAAVVLRRLEERRVLPVADL